MKTNAVNRRGLIALGALLVLICLMWHAQVSVNAAPSKSPPPAAPKQPRYTYTPGSYEDDTLLLTPTKGAEQEEIDKAIKETGGTIVGKLQYKDRTIYKLKTPKGKLTEVEKALSEDENFKQVVRNVNLLPNVASTTGDPSLASEWHLNSVRASDAWRLLHYNKIAIAPVLIAVIDSGCQSSIKDLSGGRCQAGYDCSGDDYGSAIPGGGQIDVNNHGSWVATTAAANPNNGVGTAGVAPNAFIYPLRVLNSANKSNVWKLINALMTLESQLDSGTPIKIVNLSLSVPPPNSIANSIGSVGATIKPWIDDLNSRGLIVFNSAGNDSKLDSCAMNPNICVVSAITSTNTKAAFSNYGPSVWFTAPGQNIFCSGRTGAVQAVAGTSFSAPICAAVAALIWGTKPSLTKAEVLSTMTQSCNRTKLRSYSANYFGYGVPDCVAAIQIIHPGLRPLPDAPVLNGPIDLRLLAGTQPYPVSVTPTSPTAQYQRLLKYYQYLMGYYLYYE